MTSGVWVAKWRRAWLSLAVVLGLHVADEASHDFLSWYNPIAAWIQARLGGLPFPPVFSFRIWLIGLVAMVLLCVAITPLLQPDRRWMVNIATVWAVIHIGNGLVHIAGSLVAGRLTPGTWTAPLLLMAAPWLLIETWRVTTI
jgi:hypothetical protein